MNLRLPFRFLFRWARRCAFLGLCLLLLGLLAGSGLLRGALYNRFVLYPRMESALQVLRTQREAPERGDDWREFRGVCHSHSEVSHDSIVPFEEVLAATQEADLSFIMMTDHCPGGVGDFSLQWRGLREGVLFMPGFETSSGFLVWGLPTETALDCRQEPADLATEVHALGGVSFFAHTEEDRPYELEEVSGMEIYNIHTDIMDERMSRVLGEALVTARRFPDLSLYSIFDRQESIVARWDAENRRRHFAGIAANDAHQNVGLRAVYTESRRVEFQVTSGDYLWSFPLGPLGFLGRALAGGDGEFFRLVLDPYARSLRFVNMHVLARDLTEEAITESVRLGRSYIGFNVLADSSGFVFRAVSPSGAAVMGESLPLEPDTSIEAFSPLPCRFRLYQDGERVAEGEGREFRYTPEATGAYRLEAELRVLDEWLLWVQTNPLRLGPVG